MKRQPKPFAVEIKRSRRSPVPPSSSKAELVEAGGTTPDESGSLDKVSRRAFDADLAVPVFLQSDKASYRPASKGSRQEIFKDKDHVFAPVPPSQSDGPRQAEPAARPRILPSLIEPAVSEPEPQFKPARRVRGGLSASAGEPKGATRAGRRDQPQPAPVFAAEALADSRQEETAFQKGGSVARSNSGGTRSGIANNALAGGKTRKPTAAAFVAPPTATEAPQGAWPPAPLVRSLTKRGRADAADLPPGQRWKRRLHPRAW